MTSQYLWTSFQTSEMLAIFISFIKIFAGGIYSYKIFVHISCYYELNFTMCQGTNISVTQKLSVRSHVWSEEDNQLSLDILRFMLMLGMSARACLCHLHAEPRCVAEKHAPTYLSCSTANSQKWCSIVTWEQPREHAPVPCYCYAVGIRHAYWHRFRVSFKMASLPQLGIGVHRGSKWAACASAARVEALEISLLTTHILCFLNEVFLTLRGKNSLL